MKKYVVKGINFTMLGKRSKLNVIYIAKMGITIPKCIMPWFDKYKGENKHLSLSDYIYSENGLLISIDVRL